MKVLLISASPRKKQSNTFILAQEVISGLSDAGIQTETIHLSEQNVGFCRHCEQCHKKILYCSVQDSVPGILKKMVESDGIILASPNYLNQVSALMKALFDRSTHFIHCKRLLGKYIAGVVTSGSGDDAQVLNYIRHYVQTCGAQYSGGVSCVEHAVEEKLAEAFQLGKKMAQDLQERTEFPEQIKTIEASKQHFHRLMELRKDEWLPEYAYWQNQGWL